MLYYENVLNDYLIKSDNSGFMMIIGNTKNEKISFYSEDNILNFNGQIPEGIHQYDRKPNIISKVINKYCLELLKIRKENIVTQQTKSFKNIFQLRKINFIYIYIYNLYLIIKFHFLLL